MLISVTAHLGKKLKDVQYLNKKPNKCLLGVVVVVQISIRSSEFLENTAHIFLTCRSGMSLIDTALVILHECHQ